MAAIYLIRHGQASFGAADYDKLSELGMEQACILGRDLCERPIDFDHVICGSMLRHQETAKACLAEFSIPSEIQTDARWNEYDHENILELELKSRGFESVKEFVNASTNPKQAFEKLFIDASISWMNRSHNGYTETYNDFCSRLNAALESCINDHAEENPKSNIAVFTSGGPISFIASKLLSTPESHLININWTLCNAGITKLVTTTNRTFLASLNEHAHLEKAGKKFLTYR